MAEQIAALAMKGLAAALDEKNAPIVQGAKEILTNTIRSRGKGKGKGKASARTTPTRRSQRSRSQPDRSRPRERSSERTARREEAARQREAEEHRRETDRRRRQERALDRERDEVAKWEKQLKDKAYAEAWDRENRRQERERRSERRNARRDLREAEKRIDDLFDFQRERQGDDRRRSREEFARTSPQGQDRGYETRQRAEFVPGDYPSERDAQTVRVDRYRSDVGFDENGQMYVPRDGRRDSRRSGGQGSGRLG